MNQHHLIPLEDTPTFGFAHVSASLITASLLENQEEGRKNGWAKRRNGKKAFVLRIAAHPTNHTFPSRSSSNAMFSGNSTFVPCLYQCHRHYSSLDSAYICSSGEIEAFKMEQLGLSYPCSPIMLCITSHIM